MTFDLGNWHACLFWHCAGHIRRSGQNLTSQKENVYDREWSFLIGISFCISVCQKHFSQSCKRVFITLREDVRLGAGNSRLHYEGGPQNCGYCPHFLFCCNEQSQNCWNYLRGIVISLQRLYDTMKITMTLKRPWRQRDVRNFRRISGGNCAEMTAVSGQSWFFSIGATLRRATLH